MRVLIVDDDYISRTKLKALLSSYGDCDTAPSGALAIQMFAHAHTEGVPYELITMDIDMPGMGGLLTLQKIRQLEHDNGVHADQEAKILMITIKSDSKSVMSSFNIGCESYLIKPVNPDNLRSALLKMDFDLGQRGA